jgi:uncharacterized protein (DUF885 family)
MGNQNQKDRTSALTRRNFLRLTLTAGGAVVVSPFLKACSEPAPTEFPTPIHTSVPPEDLLTGLDGLSIDDFFDQAYRRWLVRDPETLTSLGLADFYGTGDGNLTDISDEFIRQTQALESGTLDLLRAFNRSNYSPSQAQTADVYDWFLDDRVRGHPFMYDDYPLNPVVTSVHYNIYMLFTAYHPLNNTQDAADYISRLSQVDTKLAQLIDGLQRRKENGVILPSFIIPIVLNDINEVARNQPLSHPFYISFSQRLQGVTSDERKTLSEQVQHQVTTTVIPAYQKLAGFLTDLQSDAPNDIGVWQFTDGDAYYAQSLRRQTTIDMAAVDIHELGKVHVERIQAEMRTLFAALGYPDGESITALYNRLTADSGSYQSQGAVTAYEQTIHGAEELLPQAFEILPRTKVQVIGGTDGDYYMPAAYDGSRPGLFYVRTTGSTPKFGVKSLAYHETVPGHHLQIALAQEQRGLPALRQGMQFNAYTEGWALYAERLMWELGAYTNDPQGDLGRLRMEAFRAARLVVDTGIHGKRWSFDQAVKYLADATGFPQSESQREITRYSVWPGQATSYYIGFLKFLELRQKAMDALGSGFDLKTFHRVILVNGSIPLTVLENLVDDSIGGVA